MNTLTPLEQEFFKCLHNVDPDSIWGLSIHLVLKEPTEEKFRGLIVGLKSQCKDSPRIMQGILTPECYETLQQL